MNGILFEDMPRSIKNKVTGNSQYRGAEGKIVPNKHECMSIIKIWTELTILKMTENLALPVNRSHNCKSNWQALKSGVHQKPAYKKKMRKIGFFTWRREGKECILVLSSMA